MPTPITPERLAELQAMPRDPNSSYAVINRTDFDGLLAAVEEAAALRARVAELTETILARVVVEVDHMHACGGATIARRVRGYLTKGPR